MTCQSMQGLLLGIIVTKRLRMHELGLLKDEVGAERLGGLLRARHLWWIRHRQNRGNIHDISFFAVF
jgi:hypothetical protein